ncbi:MAG: S41 family peptidase [Candidatus Peregrinibacteria bacterium]
MTEPWKKSSSRAPQFIGLFLLIIFIFLLGWSAGANHAEQNRDNLTQNFALSDNGELSTVDMQLFWDTWNSLFSKYVDPHLLDTREMVYGAVRGMVSAVGDPYTAYMTPKENKEFQDNLDGTLEGIGAELTLKNQWITIVSPVKNSPAQRAGLQPEDVIYKIDGESTENFTLEQAVMRIRGPRGSAVILTIMREGHDEPFDVRITREKINIASVEWKMKEGFAYLSVNQFGSHLSEEWSEAVSQISSRRPKGIVLDLRYNGGGFLDGAVEIASEFLEKGLVVSIKKRNPAENEEIYVNGRARLTTFPLVVLINKGSASASEIVAGAIQDHKRGAVVGVNSFGKGTVQEVVNLLGGSSLRVTVAKWYTPEGSNISETGITPDVAVERTPEDFEKQRDPQLEKAIEILKNEVTK